MISMIWIISIIWIISMIWIISIVWIISRRFPRDVNVPRCHPGFAVSVTMMRMGYDHV